MKYAAPIFRKRHEVDRLTRIHKEPRYLKQKERIVSTAWKNYFFRTLFNYFKSKRRLPQNSYNWFS